TRFSRDWSSDVCSSDLFSLFFEEDIFFNQYQDKGIEPAPIRLLGKLQNDIYHNNVQNSRNKLTFDDLNDGSVSINSCYTPVRERSDERRVGRGCGPGRT